MCQKINDKRLNLTYYQLNFPSGKELVSNLIERGPKYTTCGMSKKQTACISPMRNARSLI